MALADAEVTSCWASNPRSLGLRKGYRRQFVGEARKPPCGIVEASLPVAVRILEPSFLLRTRSHKVISNGLTAAFVGQPQKELSFGRRRDWRPHIGRQVATFIGCEMRRHSAASSEKQKSQDGEDANVDHDA